MERLVTHFEIVFDCNRTQVAIVWIGVLFMVAMFREMAHHCTAYDEEHTIMRARVVRS